MSKQLCLKKYVFSPFGQHHGLKPKVVKRNNDETTENKILEKAFRQNKRINDKQVQGLAKQLNWNERRVRRWIRRRMLLGKPTTLNKFTEAACKSTYYFSAFCYGLYVVWDKPWLWTIKYCLQDLSHHSVTDDIWWYYMLQLGFNWSLIISQFLEEKRKDFLQMLVHHIITLALLTLSWAYMLIRIGCLIAIVHDSAIAPLHAGKMAQYVGNQRVVNACFVVFLVSWIISRLVIFPFKIIYSTMYESLLFIPTCPAYYILNSLLCALQVLNFIWTWMLVKAVLRIVSSKHHEIKDCRSDSDEITNGSSEIETGD